MTVSVDSFFTYLDEERGDLPEELKRGIKSQVLGCLRETRGSEVDDATRSISLDELYSLLHEQRSIVAHWIATAFQYFKIDSSHSLDEESVLKIEVTRTEGVYSSTSYSMLGRDRAEQLVDEAFDQQVAIDFQETPLHIEHGKGLRSWMFDENVLRAKGIARETVERYRVDGQLPAVFLVNGISSSMNLPFLQQILKLLQRLGIQTGAVECKPFKKSDGTPYLHSFTERCKALEAFLHLPQIAATYDPRRVVFIGHSLGGGVCQQTCARLQHARSAVQPFLLRIATPVPTGQQFSTCFGHHDHRLFTGEEEYAPDEYSRALQPAPNSSIPSRGPRAFLFHDQDILVREGLYRMAEGQQELVMRMGPPLKMRDGVSGEAEELAALEEEMIGLKERDTRQFQEQLRAIMSPHNFSDSESQRKALRYITAIIVPYLLPSSRKKSVGKYVRKVPNPFEIFSSGNASVTAFPRRSEYFSIHSNPVGVPVRLDDLDLYLN